MVFNAIWAILKPLLDPVVRNKIDFTKSEADLKKYIPGDHLPKGMGGDEDWEWYYGGPKEGENKCMQNEEEKKEKLKCVGAPPDWTDAPGSTTTRARSSSS